MQQLQYVLQPGDRILFERGGTTAVKSTSIHSGTTSQPIVIGAYGWGAAGDLAAMPTAAGPSTKATSGGPAWHTGEVRVVNGALMTLARYPQHRLVACEHPANTQLNRTSLTQANGYWNGARLVVRSTNWCYDDAKISGFPTEP